MRYYQSDQYPIEFVWSENIDKHFESHNHVGHYIISLVTQGVAAVHFCEGQCRADCSDAGWIPAACDGRTDIHNQQWKCYKGDLFIIPPYAMHSVYQKKNTRLLSMCIGSSFVEETDYEAAENILRNLLRDAVKQDVMTEEQGEKLRTAVRNVYCDREEVEKYRKEMDPGIKTLTDRLISYPEREFPIEALAADIFVSKYYFLRKFKSSIGMSPHHFCIQNRIRKSQSLLNAEKTIGEISAEMGFYDQSHFNKAFRRIVGISPSEYIRSKKKLQQAI
ncbi:MAG: helix-turn-helix transcriptional regulator [Lachnospiraceae bacterium]|nr:helix-turn-helix transcriptional regulator [Lachnospiraceae bacterium]